MPTTLKEILDAEYDWPEVFTYASGAMNQQGGGSTPEALPGFDVPTTGFDRHDIEELYQARAGEHDGPEWIAYGRLRDGRFFSVRAGCDYTGWD